MWIKFEFIPQFCNPNKPVLKADVSDHNMLISSVPRWILQLI